MITKVYRLPKIPLNLANEQFETVLSEFLAELSTNGTVSFEHYYMKIYTLFETVDDKLSFGHAVIDTVNKVDEPHRHSCKQICRYAIHQTEVIERINGHSSLCDLLIRSRRKLNESLP